MSNITQTQTQELNSSRRRIVNAMTQILLAKSSGPGQKRWRSQTFQAALKTQDALISRAYDWYNYFMEETFLGQNPDEFQHTEKYLQTILNHIEALHLTMQVEHESRLNRLQQKSIRQRKESSI